MKAPRFKKHPYFDLMLPSEELLFDSVGKEVLERRVCHEWPLSCVERVTFEGGIEKYCKSMRSPSMEIESYTNLRSALFVPHSVLGQDEVYGTIMLDAFCGKRLSHDFVMSAQFSDFLKVLKSELNSISGERPMFVDFSSCDSVSGHMAVMLDRLHRLFGPGATQPIDLSLLQLVKECVSNRAVRDAFTQDVVYSNGDLSADNILMNGSEFRVIDWQFPRLNSINVELVNLYASVGVDPLSQLSKNEVAAGLLCKIRWFAECADKWLPSCNYYNEITTLITQLSKL